jgi:hypothetical protein
MGKQLQLQVIHIFLKNFYEPQKVKNEIYEDYLNMHKQGYHISKLKNEDTIPV